jgi:hypothetical protein
MRPEDAAGHITVRFLTITAGAVCRDLKLVGVVGDKPIFLALL